MLVRAKGLLLTAAVIGLAVVVGLLAVGGTWALWSATTASNAGTVQAADFRVELNGAAMTNANGLAATVAVPSQGALTPTSPVFALVTVTNATNAGAPFPVVAALGAPQISGASVQQLPQYLTVRTAVAPASGSCADAAYSATPASVVVPKGTAAGFCVRVTLPENAPGSLQNATATVTIPVTATQKGN